VKYGHESAAARVRFRAGRGRFRFAVFCCSALAFAGCKENLSAPILGLGPDTSGPLVQLYPAHDTVVDSVGTMLIRVGPSDRSGVAMVLFNIDHETVTDTVAVTVR
jgi:hypothetical protein